MPSSDLRDVPYFDQYFGIWMMYEPSFSAQFNMLRKAELHVHLESRQAVGASSAARSATTKTGSLAIVSLSGKLMKQESSMGGGTSTVAARRELRALKNDADISGVMLHIDSPGGTVAGTQDLAADIAALSAAKPTHSYFEDLAASAAYWAGSQSRFISAGPTTLSGSIGTYAAVYDMSGAAAMEGVKAYVVRAGQFKGMGTPGTEISPEQLTELQRNVDSLNAHFIDGVAAGRKMSRAKVLELADGRVHVGEEAKALGLIDAVESFDAAMARLQQQALKGN